MNKFKLWGGLLAIFASGFAVGFFVSGIHAKHSFERIFAGGPQASRDVIMKRLTHELALNESQREQVGRIVCRAQAELFQIRRTRQPEVRAILDAGIVEMKQYLDPEQSRKLDEHFEKVKHRWLRWREPPPDKDLLNECGQK